MNWQYDANDLAAAYRRVARQQIENERRMADTLAVDVHRQQVVRFMQEQLIGIWDRHAERIAAELQSEREPVAVSDARFLKALKIAPMEEQ